VKAGPRCDHHQTPAAPATTSARAAPIQGVFDGRVSRESLGPFAFGRRAAPAGAGRDFFRDDFEPKTFYM
jgi:hypothetical protein